MDGGLLVVEPELERLIQEKQNDYDALLHESIMESSAEIDLKEQELALLQKSIEDCRVRRKSEEQRLHSLERLIEERSKALESKEKQLGSVQRQLNFCCRDVDAKEREYGAIRRSVEERNVELEAKGERLKSVEKQIVECERVLRLKEEECNWQMEIMHRVVSERDEVLKKTQRAIDECDNDLGAKEARLCLIEGLIREREQELKTKELEFHNVHRDFEWKEEELRALSLKIAECNKEIRAKEEELDAMQRLINGQGKELQFKRKNLLRSLREKIDQLESNKKEFDSLRWSMKERNFDLDKKEKQLGERAKDLESWKKQFEGRVQEFDSREKQFKSQVKELESKQKQFEGQMKELELEQKRFVGRVQELDSREKQFEGQVKELESKHKHFEVQVKEFESKEKQFVGQVKVYESKENTFEAQMKKLESRGKQYERRVKELDLKEQQFEVRVKEVQSKEKQFEGQMEDLESKKKQHEVQVKLLELKEAPYKMQLKELKSEEKQFEEQMKDLEFRKNQYEEQVMELELKEAWFKVQLKELESNKKQFEQQAKELEAKQNQFEGQLKELELKEKQYKSLRKSFEEEKVSKEKSSILLHQIKTEPGYFTDANSVDNSTNLELLFNLLKKYELICSQVSDALRTSADPTKLVLDTIKDFYPPQLGQQLECDANILRRICNLFMDELKKSSPVISFHVKEEAMKLASDWKVNIAVADMDCSEVLDFFKFIATFEIGSSFNENELQRLLYIIAQHRQAPQIHGDMEKLVKLPDNQSSPVTTDGGNLQLLSYEPELIGNDILVRLQTSSDPAKLVLDIIRNPIFPQNRKGNEGVIIGESHIFLLEQLKRISPDIKPHVREEATKLALDLKENMTGCTENSLVVLGFLLLLSIYGLVSYFNEDEVLKLFEFVAQHKQAGELFRTLGFLDKIYDFVQNLITKKQHIEAVRFICTYKLADKIQPNNLLRQHMERVKRMSQKCGRKKTPERKVRARDKEIASLGDVLQCISDNNLESQDLVSEIKDRILFLEKQKDEIVQEASESSSKVEVQQPEEKRPANEAVTKNQVHQPKEMKRANEAVSKNQVKAQQPDKKKPSDGVVTLNQVKVEQRELKKCTTEAVTMNQVQKPKKKKRAIEAVASNHQLNQLSNKNKCPRTALTRSVPPVFTSYSEYQRAFIPSGMPVQFGIPTNYFGVPNPMGAEWFGNRGTKYFCHSGPHFPFR